MTNESPEAKSEIIVEVLQKIFNLVSEYASEQVGVEDIMSASDDERRDASRSFIDNSDDLHTDIMSRQRVMEAISEIISKIGDAFPDETLTMNFETLSASVLLAGLDEWLAKALKDDFWAKIE